jgi:hypothetical protein
MAIVCLMPPIAQAHQPVLESHLLICHFYYQKQPQLNQMTIMNVDICKKRNKLYYQLLLLIKNNQDHSK